MFNLGYLTKRKIKEHNGNWLQILNHPCRMLITGGSTSGKTNALLNIMSHQTDIDKIYLYAKQQLLTNKPEEADIKHFNKSIAFVEHLKIWMIFIKIMKYTTQIKNENY